MSARPHTTLCRVSTPDRRYRPTKRRSWAAVSQEYVLAISAASDWAIRWGGTAVAIPAIVTGMISSPRRGTEGVHGLKDTAAVDVLTEGTTLVDPTVEAILAQVRS